MPADASEPGPRINKQKNREKNVALRARIINLISKQDLKKVFLVYRRKPHSLRCIGGTNAASDQFIFGLRFDKITT
jgi:hypothetical protein